MKILNVRRIDLKEGCRHSELHEITFPDYKDKGWYRMMISYSAFFESIKKGRRNNGIYLYKLDDFRDIPKSEYEINRDLELPVIKHASLYTFFDYIGYDRKKKKLIKTKIYC